MPIVVTGPKGETYTINNAGDPSKINQSDINAAIVAGASGVADPATMAIIHALLDNENWVEGATWSLKTLVEEAGKWAKPVGSGTDSEKKTQFQKIQEQYNDLKKALDEMEKARPALVSEEAAAAAGTDAKTKAEAALDSLDAAIAATKEQLVQLKNKALAAAAVESAISGDDSFKVFLATLGYKAPATPTKEGESGKTTIKTEPQPSAPPNGKAATGSGAYGATPPGSAVFGMPGFDTGFQASFDFSSWMQSSYFMDMQLDSMDAIGAEQLKSQKMLMLFYYFARMAMSGDLGAMYQFLRFVGIMINRDKAKDNIHMAHKLIELQV
ncbi:MAG: hypothetical protein HYV03_05680, partial [Deltaproteobacteria bacterium]|nr:hypothetical protein [Deltaproteobacteria bacterium]